MALSELGREAAARPRIERSIAEQPRNAYAAHALAHLHYENGETAAAISFLRSWLSDYPRDGSFRGHLSWHLALAHLEQGDVEEGFRLYASAFAADDYYGPALVKLLDAPSVSVACRARRPSTGSCALASSARVRAPGLPAPWRAVCRLAYRPHRRGCRRRHGRRGAHERAGDEHELSQDDIARDRHRRNRALLRAALTDLGFPPPVAARGARLGRGARRRRRVPGRSGIGTP